ncbi:hypothetical protein [Mucilaginibacter sp. PAMB04168]|uniref:hypothetical protein n=1 Tax=Mucilaginibacter sp. PAMB04168 TaxID=3138567 RepID=UPI0031F68E04
MAKLGLKKLPASSILEVVVALVVILLVLSLSLTIYSNVMRQSLSARKLQAQFRLQEALVQLKHDRSLDLPVQDGLVIEKTLAPYENNSRLTLVYLKAYDDTHRLLAETRQIIILTDEK